MKVYVIEKWVQDPESEFWCLEVYDVTLSEELASKYKYKREEFEVTEWMVK